jgi:D-glycero-D-manno-heptose 1,7-bisphosphate phosphatase
MSVRAIFIDRDGTINKDIGYVSTPAEMVLYPWSTEALRLINDAGFKAIVLTNQSGIARGLYTESGLARIHRRMTEEMARGGARIDAIYYCPHHPDLGGAPYRLDCECRKPRPGMLVRAVKEHDIDVGRSYVVGDKASDINLASMAGAPGVLVRTGYGAETLANPRTWPCTPLFVADNLLDAVERILDIAGGRG